MKHLPSQIDQLLVARAEIDKALRSHKSEVTVLFTDVVGSTEYFDKFGDTAGVAMMFKHADLASRIIGERGGAVIKTIGDSVMASFADPVKAVRAAVAIQQGVARLNDTLAIRDQLQLRIGMNHGTAYRRDGDVYGDAVNVAARITKHTEPAQILISKTVSEALVDVSDVKFQLLGKASFKGKQEAEELFEVLWVEEDEYRRLRQRFGEAVERGDLTTLEQTSEAGPNLAQFPEKIGPYRLRELLGEGGMGTVFLAEQEEPVRRRVALKLIKLGMDTKQVVARFESERQALAMMNHTNIAKVLDAGATEQGRPYFVMEYVSGISITEYCDQNRLGTPARLALFIQACQAIQHAHQKGIIHRDIKPSNVLVTVMDGAPTVKVIDFGVAKATSQQLTEKTVYTELGVLIGTPEYMSPEQAEMGGLDIDTTTDIYSLGVLLYELLAGALPFDSKRLREAGISEIRRIIREEEPPRMSTRISTLGATASEVAKRRNADLQVLVRQLRGDLDWITLKAMEKDRTRRYQSASEVAADIRRYLSHEPVVARPPSVLYQMGKFIRRHKGPVVVAAIVAILLVTFTMTTVLQSRRIAREAETARQVSDFLVGLFRVSDPSEARGNSITAREILDEGAKRIETELKNQPLVQARLMNTMGNVYFNLGLLTQAEPLVQNGLDLRFQTLGPDNREVAESLISLGEIFRRLGKLEEAEVHTERALNILQDLADTEDLDLALAFSERGLIYQDQGKYKEAEPFLRRALDIREATLGSSHNLVVRSIRNLSSNLWFRGELQEALTLSERELKISEKLLPANHPELGHSVSGVADKYRDLGRYREAGEFYERALSIYEVIYTEENEFLASTVFNLAHVKRAQGNPQEAEPLYQRALSIWETLYGPEHSRLGWGHDGLGDNYSAQKKLAEAIDHYEQAYKIWEKGLGPEHPYVGRGLYKLGLAGLEGGDYSSALVHLNRALEIRNKALGPDHFEVGWTLRGLAAVYVAQGNYQKARTMYERALAILEGSYGPEYRELAYVLDELASLERANGREGEAAELEARAKAIRAKNDKTN